ncbi:MAG: efflux RND transporter periplasmic adaptor subunit [Planctomycetes bacterium]|nr:efflux RND transporter periplasmic adaptor subunit [Planctomycetota bacterium]
MSPSKEKLEALRIHRGHARSRALPTALILLVVFLAALGAGATWWFRRPSVAVVRTIVVQEMSARGDRTLLNASGYVVARRESTVSSKVTGKVVEVLIEEGMRVEAGQVLARTDASNLEKSLELSQAQLESARSAMLETKANLNQAERELRRVSQLVSKHAASQSELDRAETDVMSQQARMERQAADVAVSEREVAVWQQQVDDTIVRAPFAGVVTTKDAQPGEMISPISAGGGFTRTGICTIVDMSSLEIEVDVGETYINRVESGQSVEATLDSYPDHRFPAKVIAMIPTADRQKATVKVRVGFERLDPRILPQMSVKVAFQSSAEDAPTVRRSVTVPKAAVARHDGRDVVWIVRDGRAERRAVTVGRVDGDQVELAAGVSGGDRVVVEGPKDLMDGIRVAEAK